MSSKGLFAVVVFWEAIIVLSSGSIPYPEILVKISAGLLAVIFFIGFSVVLYKAFE